MRLTRLDLLAYGPFRGMALDFGRRGVHVVYGRNEAGKSTTLRAISGLLFGIDPKTPDAHVHKPADLRIGGTLEAEDGERVRIVRRKGLTNTLLDDEERAVDEGVLRRLLGGVSRDTFRLAFGLDHDTLEAGARALLEGKGDLGESLFDASVGGGGEVQRLIAQLAAEADRLYRPRGSALPVNDAIRAFADAQKTVRERQSLPDAFLTQEAGLVQATSDRDARLKARAELVREKSRLEQLRTRVPLERRLERAREAKKALGAIVEHVARVDALRDRFSAYERSIEQERAHQAEVERLSDRALEARRRAGVDPSAELDTMRLDARREARIQKALEDRARLGLVLDNGRKAAARIERELQRRATAKEASSAAAAEDPASLTAAHARGQVLGDVETRLAASRARVERTLRELEGRAAALGDDVTLDAFCRREVPAAASVERLAVRAVEVEREITRVRERGVELDRDLAHLERETAAQSGDFAPPSAAELRAAREARDAAWKSFRTADEPLLRRATELEVDRLVRDADAVADRMIREADRVTNLARLRSQAEAVRSQKAAVISDLDRATTALAGLHADLRALFEATGLPASSFAEAAQSLEQHRQIREAHAVACEQRSELDGESTRAESARVDLATALGLEPSKGLAELVVAAARRLAANEARAHAVAEEAAAIAKLQQEHEDLGVALGDDEKALAEVTAKLVELVAPLGLAADASAEEVNRSIEAQRDLFAILDKRSDAEARARAAVSEVGAFEMDVMQAQSELGPGPDATPSSAARDAAQSLFQRAALAKEALRETAALEAHLAETVDVAPTDAERALAADPVAALAREQELTDALEETESEIRQLEQKIGSYKSGLDAMRAESNAAEAAASAQASLARVRAGAEQWCRAKLAMVILSREIERYREEHQGPLLTTSSALFTRLTLGAFAGVKAGFDDKDRPSLRCVRAGGAEVDVTGLSDGTRDQLYLSLRLASLLRRADFAAPMPLILDDVLIQLDDARASAALQVLAEVAHKMQVLFFTHHARLVDLARAAIPASDLVVHELSSAPLPVEAAAPAE